VIAKDEKYWKLSYKISKSEDPEDNEDDELRELLFDNVFDSAITSAEITAEIKKVEGAEDSNSNVVEFSRTDGSPGYFNSHVLEVIKTMLPSQVAENEGASA